MKLEFVSRGYQIDGSIRQFTEEKLRKAMRFLEEPVEVRATLELERHRHGANLHVVHRHGVIEAAEQTADMQDAINLAVDKLEKQARRARKRFMDRRRRSARTNGVAHAWAVDVVESGSVRAGAPRIIKSSLLQIKPMTIDEAALHLEAAEEGFVVFRDSHNDRISVLYRRRDQNYGLIAPEF